MSQRKRLIVIAGPTAVGKTNVSLQVAEHYNTEIISCDSRQLYKEISIGTAKPSIAELARIPHHFIDHISIKKAYTTHDYEQECDHLLDRLFSQHDEVVMTGGTGLYIKAVLEGLDKFPDVKKNTVSHYENIFLEKGIESLQEELVLVDPSYYKRVDLSNSRRLIRALSVYKESGKPYSSFLRKKNKELSFDVELFVLDRPRDILYKRIEERVDQMIEQGLLAEAKSVYDYRTLPALQTVGYKEIFEHLDGRLTLDQAIDKIKQHTRNYAKRQLTWFRKMSNVRWLDIDQVNEKNIVEQIVNGNEHLE